MQVLCRHLTLMAGLLLLISISSVSWGQRPVFRNFTIEEGLPSNETYMAMEDSHGYLWISTDHGLARFDGYEFQSFTTEEGLPENSVLGTYEDHWGRVWCFTLSEGFAYFDGKQMQNREFILKRNPYYRAVVSSMYVEDDESINYATRYHRPLRIHKFKHKDSLMLDVVDASRAANYIQFDGPGKLLFSSSRNEELAVCDRGEVHTLDLRGREDIVNTQKSVAVCERKSGGLLIAYWNMLIAYKDGQFQLLARFPDENNLGILEDSRGNVWISLKYKGVLVYRNGNFADPPERWLEEATSSHIEEDREGGIWVTTLDRGVFYTASADMQAMSSEEYFEDRELDAIVANEDGFLAAARDGQTFGYAFENGQAEFVSSRMLVPNLRFFGQIGDSVAILGNVFDRLNIYTRKFLRVPDLEIVHESRNHLFLQFPLEDSLFFSSNGYHIFSYDMRQDSMILWSKNKARKWTYAAQDGDSIWLGGRAGTGLWDGQKLIDLRNLHPNFSIRITGLKMHQGKLLMATYGSGLLVYDGKEFKQISKREGLLSNICNGLEVDHEEHIWVPSNSGISRITHYEEGKPPVILNYTGVAQLISNEVKKVNVLEEYAFAVSTKGVSIIPRTSDYMKAVPPLMRISRVEVNDRDTVVDGSLNLNHDQNHLSFFFTGISFRSSGNMGYRYRLLGLDTIWRYTTATQLDYPQLDPGSYQFEVVAENATGLESKETAIVTFEIRSPFWTAWWFYISLFLVVGSGLGGLIQFRFQQVTAAKNMRLAYLESEQKALRVQITPHFIFNAINSILGLIAERKNDLAAQGLSRFARLMRQILELSEKKSVALSQELETLKLYLDLERLRFGNQFSYDIDLDPEIDPDFTELPTMVIQPYVENAIKHGLNHKLEGSKEIELRFWLEGDVLVVTVKDNGIGREEAQRIQLRERIVKSGKGMKISGERVRMLNETMNLNMDVVVDDLKDEDGRAAGTQVTLYIPQPW